MSAPLAPAPWTRAAGNKWTICGDGTVDGDGGNETIVDNTLRVVAYVPGGRESGNGAMLAAAPLLRDALVQLAEHPCAHPPTCGHTKFSACRNALVATIDRISFAALKQAGAL